MGSKKDLISQMNTSLSDYYGKPRKDSKMTALKRKYNELIRKMKKTEDVDKFNSFKKDSEEILKEIKELKKLKEIQKNLKNLTNI